MIKYLQKAQELKKIDPSEALNELKKIKPDQINDKEKLKEYYKISWDIYKDMGNSDKVAQIMQECEYLTEDDAEFKNFHNKMLGIYHVEKGEYSKGIEYFNSVLTYARQSKNIAAIVAETANIGVLFRHLGKFDQALEYLEKALSLAQKNNIPLHNLYLNLSSLYSDLGRNEDATEYCLKAKTLFEQNNNALGLISSSLNLGVFVSYQGEYEEAAEILQTAKEMAQKYKFYDKLAQINHNIGLNLVKMEKYQEALTSFQDELIYVQKNGRFAEQDAVLREIADIYYKSGKYKKAYETLQIAADIKTKYLDEQTQINIAKYQAQMEMSEKLNEKEQLLLLYARQAEMGQMIAAIAHQWRQPLNALSIILDSIYDAWEFDDLDSDSLHTKIASGKEIIHSMSKTINDFRSFFQTDQMQDVFNVREVLEKAVRFTDYRFRQRDIKLQYSIKNDCLIEGSSNQLLQVVLIILNNAYDAFKDKNVQAPFVSIWQKVEHENTIIHIADNAGGIPELILPKIFNSNYSTKTEKDGTGIGLYLAKMIIELKFHGSISVMNKNNGAIFTIKVPILKKSEK